MYKVVENFTGHHGQRRWRVWFDDGHVTCFSGKELERVLVLEKRVTEGNKLDYILVSDR